MNYWFTSDYHFGHANIIKHCLRPFKTVNEMDNKLINNHNSLVAPDDVVYFLGDFSTNNTAQKYLKRLNGNFVFIKGNHDHKNKIGSLTIGAIIEHYGKQLFLVHDPKEYEPAFSINLVGHVHTLWRIKKIDDTILVNVGCDVWNFRPIQLKTILTLIEKFESNVKTNEKDPSGQR